MIYDCLLVVYISLSPSDLKYDQIMAHEAINLYNQVLHEESIYRVVTVRKEP